MCKCLDEFNKSLKEKTGDPDAEISESINFTRSEAYPYMSYTYRGKKKDGTFRKAKYTGLIAPSFCPFCGKEYHSQEEKV